VQGIIWGVGGGGKWRGGRNNLILRVLDVIDTRSVVVGGLFKGYQENELFTKEEAAMTTVDDAVAGEHFGGGGSGRKIRRSVCVCVLGREGRKN